MSLESPVAVAVVEIINISLDYFLTTSKVFLHNIASAELN